MPHDRPITLTAISKNKTNPAYAGARCGMGRTAARFGASVRHLVPETPDDAAEQSELIQQAIAQRPDALLLAPAHPSALNPTLRRVEAAGIPIFCFVSKPDDVQPVTFVGSDNDSLASAVAERLLDHLRWKGAIVILEGSPESTTSAPRTRGFRAAAARHEAIRIIDLRAGHYQKEPARRAMAEMLTVHPRIDGVLAANDLMAMGALEAMEAAGRRIPIVGVNATPDGIAAIKAGRLLASAAFDAMRMGCIAVEAAIRHLRGEALPKSIDLPVETVGADNCATWDLPYEERPLPDWRLAVDGHPSASG